MSATGVHEFLFDAAFPFLGGKFKDYFLSLGSWDLTAGDAQLGYLGSRFVNVLGEDWRLVFSPFGWTGMRNPFMDLALGLGDDVSFTYGGRTQATYGGPVAQIVRGLRINKFGGNELDILGAANVPTLTVESPIDFLNDPEDPDHPGNSDVAKSMDVTDDNTFIAVTALGVCLTLITNILEIVAHATFGEYDKATGHATITADDGTSGAITSGDDVTINKTSFNATSDISSGFRDIRIAHRWLPRRLMGLIYHIEMAGTLSGYMYNLGDGLKRIAIKIGRIVAYCIPPAGLFLYEHEAQRLETSIRTVGFWLKFILAIIFLIIIILLFVGVM